MLLQHIYNQLLQLTSLNQLIFLVILLHLYTQNSMHQLIQVVHQIPMMYTKPQIVHHNTKLYTMQKLLTVSKVLSQFK